MKTLPLGRIPLVETHCVLESRYKLCRDPMPTVNSLNIFGEIGLSLCSEDAAPAEPYSTTVLISSGVT